MNDEALLRIGVFASLLGLFALAEACWPRRRRGLSRFRRWPTNLGLVLINSLLLRLLFPTAAVGAAVWTQQQGLGVLPLSGIPAPLQWLLGFILLDLAIYGQHVVFHKVPLLWRLHRVHHTDCDLDVTSGLRFHPVEIVLSMCFKWLVIVALGVPATAVLAFEIVLNACAMFNHANLRLPLRVDALVRRILVTPDMHRVHHSDIRVETDSNYGFNFPFWDRLFGTYTAQPSLGHVNMQLGVRGYDPASSAQLAKLLAQPLTDKGA